jgi:uncharacterized surface protein with fasciclin (FAS1) repeats
MKKNKHKSIIPLTYLILFIITVVISCRTEHIDPRTIDNPLVATYIDQFPEKYSEYSALLDTTGLKPFLKAYGTYTCFIPNNDAFKKFATQKGIASWRNLSMEDLINLVKYSVIKDTIASKYFSDGKISVKNMYGHFLASGSINDGGTLKLRINKLATIVERDIRVDNGIIQEIDDVLEPPVLSIAQVIENQPGYSIFIQALHETGWYDTINKISVDTSKMVWYTIVGESDQVLQNNGINSYDQLKQQFCHTGNPQNPIDSLNLFIAYHCIKGLNYVSDIPTLSSYETYAPNEVITTASTGDSIYLNRQTINDVFEPGVPLSKTSSDFFSANGVFHTLNGLMKIKTRNPYPIYWDVCEQPELVIMPNFRKIVNGVGYDYPFPSPVKTNVWKQMQWTCGGTKNGTIGYKVADSTMNGSYVYQKGRYNFNDVMYINFRKSNTVNGIDSVIFTTPFVPKGEYKIWICNGMKSDNRENRTSYLDVYVDNQLMPNQIYEWVVLDTTMTDDDLEFLGYKRYLKPDMPCPVFNNALPKDLKGNTVKGSCYVGRLVGKVKFEKHGTHKIKIDCVTVNLNAGYFNLDMIHIIPANMDQVWPKFNSLGQQVFKE